MGVLLKNNLGWAPKKNISDAFFEDVLGVINDRKKYLFISKEIREAVQFYSYTLDFRNKSNEEIKLLLELVIVLVYFFDEKYKERLKEEPIFIYKNSLIELKNILFESIESKST